MSLEAAAQLLKVPTMLAVDITLATPALVNLSALTKELQQHPRAFTSRKASSSGGPGGCS